MEFIKIHTRAMLPPKDDIYKVIDESVKDIKDGDVLLITSKVLGIHQGRCVKIGDADKDKLVIEEADKVVTSHLKIGSKNITNVPKGYMILTLKDNTLIPASGIDESNANGYYILWPREVNKQAKEICEYLRKKFSVKKLAVVVTDSHTIPLRRGVMGISIGFYGLNPLKDYRGKPDIFGRELKFTTSNIVDTLAAMSVLLMGEANEQTPMLIVRGADFVEFTDKENPDFLISIEEDLYAPLLKVFEEKKA